MKRTMLKAATALATATLLLPATPADATITGGVTFQCTAVLDDGFPTPFGTGTCTGTAHVGAATGQTTGGVTYVIGGTNRPFSASFTYNESCPAALPEPPPIGTATGTARITGIPVHQGPGVTADVSTSFSWTRVEGTALILTSNTTVTFRNASGTAVAVATAVAPDVGAAGFVPTGTVGTCTAPVAVQRASVVGGDVILV